MYVVEANADAFPARVFPATNQAHWDGGEPYLAEAERIAKSFIDASFPSHAQDLVDRDNKQATPDERMPRQLAGSSDPDC